MLHLIHRSWDMLVPPLPKAFRLPLEEVSAKAVFRD